MPPIIGNFFDWAGVGIPAFLFVITVIVFFHELGHFTVARLFGVKVQTFSIGFGGELFGWTDRHGTRWKISWLPLGGFVQFAGDADASSRPDEEMQHLPEAARAGMLQFKPLYQRALVVLAGPLANFILAIAIFAGFFIIYGRPADPPVVAQITQDSAAAAAGLQAGDVIRSIDGIPVATFLDLQQITAESPGKILDITVQRGGGSVTLTATPRPTDVKDVSGKKHVIGMLGITDQIVPVGPLEAVGLAATQTWFVVEQTMRYMGRLVMGYESGSQLSGPLGIAKISGDVAQAGFLPLIRLAALVSISIGLVNLFPIPVLDGGHLLYYGCEAVLGRPLGARAQEVGFRLGLALVLGLLLLATFNDLVRFNLF